MSIMADSKKELINLNEWCYRIVKAGYIASALTILAHVIWYFADRNTMKVPQETYLLNYVVFPAIGLFVLNLFAGTMVRSIHVSLLINNRCHALSHDSYIRNRDPWCLWFVSS